MYVLHPLTAQMVNDVVWHGIGHEKCVHVHIPLGVHMSL